jgi:hypothetical protein
MVIMIDDLDRCRPESVLDILEAVNFLADAGPCFIFLGIDVKKVRDAVAYGFKDSVLNLPTSEDAGSGSLGVDTVGLKEFAESYLKKLINILVAVPTLTEEESRKFAASSRENKKEASPWPERLRAWTHTVTDFAGAAVAFALIIFLSFQLVATMPRAVPEPLAAEATVTDKETTRPQSNNEEVGNKPVLNARDPRQTVVSTAAVGRKTTVSAADLPDNRAGIIAAVLALSLLVIVISNVRRATIAPGGAVRDTDDFALAQHIWNPAIFSTNPTPRDMKRHHNHLRFTATRLRPASRRTGWLDRFFERGEPDNSDVINIPEPMLVALGAIEAMGPNLLQMDLGVYDETEFSEKVRQKLETECIEVDIDGPPDQFGKKTTERLKVFDAFNRKFSACWPPTEEQFSQYLRLSATLETEAREDGT